MARTRDPQPANFILLLVVVYSILLSMAQMAFKRGGWWVETGFLYTNVGCMFMLAFVSIWLRTREEVRLLTASTNIIAMGIFCLLLGMGLSVHLLKMGVKDMGYIGETLKDGLLSAGISTALAVAVRTIEAQLFANGKSGGGMSAGAAATIAATGIDPALVAGLTDAFENMRRELEAGQGEVRALVDGLRQGRVMTDEWGKLLEKLRRFFPAAGGPGAGVP